MNCRDAVEGNNSEISVERSRSVNVGDRDVTFNKHYQSEHHPTSVPGHGSPTARGTNISRQKVLCTHPIPWQQLYLYFRLSLGTPSLKAY